MKTKISIVVALGFLAVGCGPADLADGVTEDGAVISDAPEEASTASTEQTLCSGWGAWAKYPRYAGCSCGTASAWATTASATDSAASGWTAGRSHAGKSRRVQAKCSRPIDGRTVTVTGTWTTTSSNIFAKCPPSYPDVVGGRCEIR